MTYLIYEKTQLINIILPTLKPMPAWVLKEHQVLNIIMKFFYNCKNNTYIYIYMYLKDNFDGINLTLSILY